MSSEDPNVKTPLERHLAGEEPESSESAPEPEKSLFPTKKLSKFEEQIDTLFWTPGIGGKWGTPGIFIGPPGVGKTAQVEQWARDNGVPFKYLSPALHGDGLFGVVPVPVQTPNGRTVLSFPPPAWAEEMRQRGRGLIFLDELTTASPIVQSACLALLNERRLGDMDLGGGVRVIAAGNPLEYTSGGFTLSPAASNRMCWLTAGETVEVSEFVQYLQTDHLRMPAVEHSKSSGLDFAPDTLDGLLQREAATLAKYSETLERVQKAVAPILAKQNSQTLLNPLKDQMGAWPSPRSIHMALRLMAYCILTQRDPHLYVVGCVGLGVGQLLLRARVNLENNTVGHVTIAAAFNNPTLFWSPKGVVVRSQTGQGRVSAQATTSKRDLMALTAGYVGGAVVKADPPDDMEHVQGLLNQLLDRLDALDGSAAHSELVNRSFSIFDTLYSAGYPKALLRQFTKALILKTGKPTSNQARNFVTRLGSG
jgi:hypothetical protein